MTEHALDLASTGMTCAGCVAAVEKALAMVGDGANDAAMRSAGITLLRGDPRLVEAAIAMSRATHRKIRWTPFRAFVYNVIGLPLPVFAGAAMAFSSVSVVTSSLLPGRRLRRRL